MAKKQTQEPLEVGLVLAPEVNQLVQNSKVAIALKLGQDFTPYMERVNQLTAKIDALESVNPTKEDADSARKYRLELVANRGSKGAEGKKTELKEDLIPVTRLIDDLNSAVAGKSKEAEARAEAIEKHQENIERQHKETQKAVRELVLEQYGIDTTYLPLGDMTQEQFDQFADNSKLAHQAKQDADRLAELERVRLQQQADAKQEADRLAREVFVERLRRVTPYAKHTTQEVIDGLGEMREPAFFKLVKDLEKTDKEVKKQAEIDRKAREKREVELTKAREESLNRIKILEAKQKAIDDDLQAQVEAKRKADAVIAEQAKQALLAPDKEKVRVFFNDFKKLQFPALASAQGKAMSARVAEALDVVAKLIIQDSKTLL